MIECFLIILIITYPYLNLQLKIIVGLQVRVNMMACVLRRRMDINADVKLVIRELTAKVNLNILFKKIEKRNN